MCTKEGSNGKTAELTVCAGTGEFSQSATRIVSAATIISLSWRIYDADRVQGEVQFSREDIVAGREREFVLPPLPLHGYARNTPYTAPTPVTVLHYRLRMNCTILLTVKYFKSIKYVVSIYGLNSLIYVTTCFGYSKGDTRMK